MMTTTTTTATPTPPPANDANEKKKESSSKTTKTKNRKKELSQRATTEQIAKEMFTAAGILENENEEKIIRENFVNEAAEYFHKHQNFANKWLHLLTMPMLILPDSAICNDTKYPCQNIWLMWRTILRRSMASIIFCIYSRATDLMSHLVRARSFTFVTHRREIFLPPRCGSCVGGYRAR